MLGLLKQDPTTPDYYRSSLELPSGEVIAVTLDAQYVKDEDFPTILEHAHKAYSAILTHKEKFHRLVAAEYLSEYNEICRRQNPASEEEFLSKIRLESVEFWQDGCFQLYFSPVGLEDFFGDHIVKIRFNPDLSVDIIKMQ